jgi:hypothetical protein
MVMPALDGLNEKRRPASGLTGARFSAADVWKLRIQAKGPARVNREASARQLRNIVSVL